MSVFVLFHAWNVWLCEGISGVVSKCVFSPELFPSVSNSDWELSNPTGTLPFRFGRLKVVEPLPTTYSALFNVIGIGYGAGNGSTTFNLPNLKGKVPVGYDNSQSEFDTLGKSGGEKTHILTTPEMPSHNHTFQAWNNTNTDTSDIFTNDWRLDPGSGTWGTSNTGGGLAHNNLQPYIVINYVIRY